jgi:hypothetical protein
MVLALIMVTTMGTETLIFLQEINLDLAVGVQHRKCCKKLLSVESFNGNLDTLFPQIPGWLTFTKTVHNSVFLQ